MSRDILEHDLDVAGHALTGLRTATLASDAVRFDQLTGAYSFSQGVTLAGTSVTGDYITGKSGNQTWTASTSIGGTLKIRAAAANHGSITLESAQESVSLVPPVSITGAGGLTYDGWNVKQTSGVLITTGATISGSTPGFNLATIYAPNYSATAATQVITNASTLAITGAPVASTNVTITNPRALWVQAGTVQFDGTTVLASLTGMLKGTSGTVSVATAGTDYQAPMSPANATIVFPTSTTVGVGVLNGTYVQGFTVGSVIFAGAAGSLSEANASLFWDNTHNRLGVGLNSSLQAPLHVIADSGTARAIRFSDSGGTDFVDFVNGGSQVQFNIALAKAYILNQAGNPKFQVDSTGNILFYPLSHWTTTLQTPGSNYAASTEVIATLWDQSRTATWATGALATQREFRILAPNYAFAGASTITEAVTVAIQSSPFVGTNATILRAIAFKVEQGFVTLNVTGGPSIASATATTLDAFLVSAGTITVTGTTGIATAAGFNFATIQAPTITDASACTITTSATLSILGAPIAGGSITITNPYALWIQGGNESHQVGGETIKAAGREYFDIAPISTPSGGGVTVNHLYTTRIRQQTFANSGASNSISGLSTSLYIDGPPVYTGTWATGYTNASLYVATGNSFFGGQINVFNGGLTSFTIDPVANTLFALMEVNIEQPPVTIASGASVGFGSIVFSGAQNNVTISGSSLITTATGFNYFVINPPNFSNATASIVADSATVYIGGPPTISGGGSIIRPYSLWIDNGLLRYDGQIANGGGATATLGTIGGSGPATAAANGWIKINVDGSTRFLATWG